MAADLLDQRSTELANALALCAEKYPVMVTEIQNQADVAAYLRSLTADNVFATPGA